MKHRTPKGYRAPLTKRADIVEWLTKRPNGRPSYGLFTFNVKCYNVDLSFDHLLALAQESGEVAKDVSAGYLSSCRALYNELRDNQLWDSATQDASCQVMEIDGYRMLWDGSEPIAEWEFAGRSGGWLVLKSFDGVDLNAFDLSYLLTGDGSTDTKPTYRWLRRLYRFLVQCDHDFRREAIKSEIEHKAAFNLFANICSDVKEDARDENAEPLSPIDALKRCHDEADYIIGSENPTVAVVHRVATDIKKIAKAAIDGGATQTLRHIAIEDAAQLALYQLEQCEKMFRDDTEFMEALTALRAAFKLKLQDKRKVWVLIYDNDSGLAAETFNTEAAAKTSLFLYVKTYWPTEMTGKMPKDQSEAIAEYFARDEADDRAHIEQFEIQD